MLRAGDCNAISRSSHRMFTCTLTRYGMNDATGAACGVGAAFSGVVASTVVVDSAAGDLGFSKHSVGVGLTNGGGDDLGTKSAGCGCCPAYTSRCGFSSRKLSSSVLAGHSLCGSLRCVRVSQIMMR